MLKEQLNAESEGFFNAIVENSSNFIAIVQDEKFVFVNSAGLNLFGTKSSADIIGKNIKELINTIVGDVFVY